MSADLISISAELSKQMLDLSNRVSSRSRSENTLCSSVDDNSNSKEEFKATLKDMQSACHSEVRRLEARAVSLSQDTTDRFKKMSPEALDRLKGMRMTK